MKKNVVCFGEVLWDVLPTGKLAGGAPMNVAIRLQSLGVDAAVISKIGNDINGTELLSIIENAKVNTSLIQKGVVPTGTVQVTLDANGNASYEIVYPSAWDKIELNETQLSIVANADTFVFGSLATRDEISRNTLNSLIEVSKWNVFDVNLRSPFYDIPAILETMKNVSFVKLNDDELALITASIGGENLSLEEQTYLLSKHIGIKSICVTKGANGAILLSNDKLYSHPGYKVVVQDTIGAGDSFLATLLAELLNNVSPEKALDNACAMGALVASKAGANAIISTEELAAIKKSSYLENSALFK
jgi:fructokinase